MQVETTPSLSVRQLPFPAGSGTFVYRGENGESVVLTSSSEWSRKTNEGFRLHSSRSLTAPAALEWSQVPLNGFAYRLGFAAKLAVDRSMPAYVVLKASADGKLIGAWSAEVEHQGVSCEMLIPKGFELLSIEVQAMRFADLVGGEVSVIDISPVELTQQT
ncbi:MAG: hypothetical protein U5L74_15305 [Ideonella sp.]|nr:hypothetical protein [Ideonella sp.]